MNDDHIIRARTLIHHDDPRIARELARTRPRTASPDEAYWQAALRVAKQDERRELAQRHPVAYTIGYTLGCLTLLAAPALLGAAITWWILT